MTYDAHYAFRELLMDGVARDLVGPSGGPEETIPDPPITQYASGVLYAQQSGTISAVEDIDIPDEEGEGVAPDPPVALANVRYPSSMGMTFAVDTSVAPRILLEVTAGRYEQLQIEGAERWKRVPLALAPIAVDTSLPSSRYYDTEDEGLKLFCRVRPADAEGVAAVTSVLVNWRQRGSGELGDAIAYFQPSITATAGVGAPENAVFVTRGLRARTGDDEDLEAYRLLYRHIHEFGVGHGCSVDWTEVQDSPGRALEVRTTYIPKQEVRLFGSNPKIQSRAVTMRDLVINERAEVVSALRSLCQGYADWIEERRKESEGLPAHLTGTARNHLEQCGAALQRMHSGVDLIEGQDDVWLAFRLMSMAMLRQRSRVTWLREGRPEAGPIEGVEHRWYPFQLAFILLCLHGVHDPESEDRELADLLWFPTGGGKTEAYLGLIAFTIFLRRLRREDGGGVTALMRYTLRLLTIQQFERATLLIACCESIRRQRSDLGTEEVSIGLWVGRDASPLTLTEARAALSQLRQGAEVGKSNPIQLQACPWCGTRLTHRNYWIADNPRRLVISCNNGDCDFEKRLPVYVVDEDVYTFHPTLIIATVDKFASLPWREKAGNLFNLDRPDQAPPELIVQDELHLISGPLGTVVGLYETALDELCSEHGKRPKIVASTATIRRAGRQTLGLFNRRVSQFPPPGLDARDSYFAVEMGPSEKGARLYVGLMAPGTSHTTLLVRTYASLFQGVKELKALPEIKDPYWTLVGYFNSLRVLGGARMQVQDDVNDRIHLLATRNGSESRPIEAMVELTSREASSSIPEHLKRMGESYPSPDALDVILATNMISVGVDVDRLSLMAVMGQPQATSEYIQATSRVGRKHPGLVFILFNSARSRDRSHYESFVTYHSALYRQVEATSVTPFSPRARDRALHAVLIGLARLTIPDLRANDAAGAISTPAVETKVRELVGRIVDRADAVSERDKETTRRQLELIVERWREMAEAGELVYSDYNKTRTALLGNAADMDVGEEAFPTLWSMRDVDQESNLYLVR